MALHFAIDMNEVALICSYHFFLQAREAAIAVQGKMVDLQRKKGKGL